MSNENLKEVEKLPIRPFTRFCMSIGAVPSSYLAGLTIEEQLLWLCSYLEKEVIPAVNNNGEAVEELQGLYVELKNYVDNYFENLDVQEEINNKLDEMAESGDLEEIISAYLNTKAILCFDNVSDMKNSINLIDGSYAQTLGYYSKNDKGKALYKIRTLTNQDVVDDMFIIGLTNNNELIAELILKDTLTLEQIGVNGSQDGTTKIQSAIDYCINNNLKLEGFGHYLTNNTLRIYDLNDNTQKTNINLNKITYSGEGVAIRIETNFATININHLVGNDSGTGILLAKGTSTLTSNNNIRFGYIQYFEKGISLKGESGAGITYNKISGDFIEHCDYDILLDSSISSSYVNQNYFYNIRCSGNDGITLLGNNSSGSLNGNNFINIGLEEISNHGLHLEKSRNNHFSNIRNMEGLTGPYWFYADNNSTHNIVEFTNYVEPDKLYSASSINIFKNGLFTSQGFPITYGEFYMKFNQFDLKDNKYNNNNRITVYDTSADLSDSSKYKYFDINKIYTLGNSKPNTNVVMKINAILEEYTQFYVFTSYINTEQNATVSINNTGNTEIIGTSALASGKLYLIKQQANGSWAAYEV